MEIAMLVVEALFLGFIVYNCIRRRAFFTKSNLLYFLPAFLITFVYQLRGAYAAGSVNILTVYHCLQYSLESFAFKVNGAYVTAMWSNVLYRVGFSFSIVFTSFTMVSVVVSIFYINVINAIVLAVKKRKTLDVVLGDGPTALAYVKNNDNTVLWLEGASRARIQELYAQKITFINAPFSAQRLVRLNNAKAVHVVAFGDDYELQLERAIAIKEAVQHITEKKKRNRVRFDIRLEMAADNVDQANGFFIRDGLGDYVKCFNRYELTAHKVLTDMPVAAYFDQSIVDYSLGTVHPDVDINVFFIGFGKINKELMQASVVVNQFVSADETRGLVPKPVHYYAFDRAKDAYTDKRLLHGIARYDEFCATAKQSDYLPLPEKPYTFEFVPSDINSPDMLEKVAQVVLSGGKKSANFFYISCGSDIGNIDYARRLIERFRESDLFNDDNCLVHVFPKVRSAFLNNNYARSTDEDITYYGGEKDVFSHSVLIAEDLYAMARAIHAGYRSNKASDRDWNSLSAFEKRSNIFAAIGARVKLLLLGLDSESADTVPVGSGEPWDTRLGAHVAFNAYGVAGAPLTPRKVLGYIEHQRWNAFHIVNGYVPMKIADVRLDDGRVINKEPSLRQHSCLTTYEGLDAYADLVACVKAGVRYTGKPIAPSSPLYAQKQKAEVYCHDYRNVSDIDKQLAVIRRTVTRKTEYKGEGISPKRNRPVTK